MARFAAPDTPRRIHIHAGMRSRGTSRTWTTGGMVELVVVVANAVVVVVIGMAVVVVTATAG